MQTIHPPNAQQWRTAITAFIHERLTAKLEKHDKLYNSEKLKFSDAEKLDKLKDDEAEKRQELLENHQYAVWLSDAAKRAPQIQLASHTAKPLHPDARSTQIFIDAPLCAADDLVGTHSLNALSRSLDVVGNAAALDVFSLLKLAPEQSSTSLLSALLANDADAVAALSDQASEAKAFAKGFLAVAGAKQTLQSHTLAKQVYFPLQGGEYHLLAPLYPTALMHAHFLHLQEMRFGDAAKASRDSRKKEESGEAYRDYPNLLLQSFGGSKPQNISQLNSKRGGKAHLLASLPPERDPNFAAPPMHAESVFAKGGGFIKRQRTRELVKSLRSYLDSWAGRKGNVEVRDQRAAFVEQLVGELLNYAAEVHCLPPGWSEAPECRLNIAQCLWLDPFAERTVAAPAVSAAEDDWEADDAEPVAVDWPGIVASAFASWFNQALATERNRFAINEHEEWQRIMKRALQQLRKELADVS